MEHFKILYHKVILGKMVSSHSVGLPLLFHTVLMWKPGKFWFPSLVLLPSPPPAISGCPEHQLGLCIHLVQKILLHVTGHLNCIFPLVWSKTKKKCHEGMQKEPRPRLLYILGYFSFSCCNIIISLSLIPFHS